VIVGVFVIGLITRPAPPGPEWVEQQGPAAPVNLDSLVATDSGFAVLSGVTDNGVLLWWSEDGVAWESQPLPGAPTRLAAADDFLVAYNGAQALLLAYLEGSWQFREEQAFPDEMRTGQSPGRSSLISGPQGWVITSILGDAWHWDLEEFERVLTNPDWGRGQTVEVPFDSSCRPPTSISPDVPAMTATDTGFLALISSNADEPFGIWPVCEPSAWLSDDGHTWSATDAAFGEGAYVYNVAWREGRMLAVGGHGIGEPAAWSSEDGERWDLLDSFDPGSSIDLYSVRAGEAGWVILGQETENSSPVGWVSPDGTCWTGLPANVDADDAVLTADRMMLVQRATYPETWMATGLEAC
jgi:hypothetical protein